MTTVKLNCTEAECDAKTMKVLCTMLDLEVDDEALTPSAMLYDLGADELHVVEILIALEEEFDIDIPDDVFGIGRGMSIGGVLDYIKTRVECLRKP